MLLFEKSRFIVILMSTSEFFPIPKRHYNIHKFHKIIRQDFLSVNKELPPTYSTVQIIPLNMVVHWPKGRESSKTGYESCVTGRKTTTAQLREQQQWGPLVTQLNGRVTTELGCFRLEAKNGSTWRMAEEGGGSNMGYRKLECCNGKRGKNT